MRGYEWYVPRRREVQHRNDQELGISRKKADGMFEVRVTGGTTMKWINEKKFHNNLLKVAVEEWCEDRSAAKAKYGHISDWNGEILSRAKQ